MSESNKIGTYKFVAEPFHVDFNSNLTMGYWAIICWIAQVFMPAIVVLALHLWMRTIIRGYFPAWQSNWMKCLISMRTFRFRLGWKMFIACSPIVILPLWIKKARKSVTLVPCGRWSVWILVNRLTCWHCTGKHYRLCMRWALSDRETFAYQSD